MGVSRLTSQNLIMSANRAIEGQATKESVQDLTALINTVVLHDAVRILGPLEIWADRARHFSLVNWLMGSGMLIPTQLHGDERERIIHAAQKHLAIALGSKEIPRFEEVLEESYLQRVCYSSIATHSDDDIDLEAGRQRVNAALPGEISLLLNPEDRWARGTMFFIRTFFYLGYMDIAKIPFVSDAIRSPFIATVQAQQMSFQAELLRKVQDAFSENLAFNGIAEWLSPFAAVVFQRCRGDRTRIIDEIANLRDEIQPDRERLFQLEDEYQYGVSANSHADTRHVLDFDDGSSTMRVSQKARRRFKEALDELTERYGTGGQPMESREMLALGTATAGVAMGPLGATNWIKLVSSLPVNEMKRMFTRRRFAEMYRLFSKLRGPAVLQHSIEQLFGTTMFA